MESKTLIIPHLIGKALSASLERDQLSRFRCFPLSRLPVSPFQLS